MSDIPRTPAPQDEADLGTIEEGDDVSEVDEGAETPGDEASGDGDEGEEEGPEAEDVDEPAPRRGGGSQTIRAQRARAQAAERELAEVKRQIAELQGFTAGAASRQQDPQAAARAEQEFYAQLETLPPAQAYQAIVNRERQNIGGAIQQLRFEQQELADQARYDASCARSPIRETYRERVEQYRAQQRRAGFVIGREEAFHLLFGRDAEARAAKARPGQVRAGQARIAGQQTRPTGSRSNLAPGGRRPAPGSAEADAAAIAEADAKGIKIW